MCSSPRSRLSPLVSIARSSTSGLVSAKLDGAHRVDEGPGHEPHLLARLRVHPLDRVDRSEQPLGDQQIGLADHVEQRIVAPFRARRSACPCRPSRARLRAGRHSRPAPAARSQAPRSTARPAPAPSWPDRRTSSPPASAAATCGGGPAPPCSPPRPSARRDAPSSSAAPGPSPRSSAASRPATASECRERRGLRLAGVRLGHDAVLSLSALSTERAAH